MADQLTVNPDGLELFAQRMDTAGQEFETANRSVSTWTSSVGSNELATALQEFDQRWTAAQNVIESFFHGIAMVARDVATAVRATDHSLAGTTPTQSPHHLMRADS